MIDFSAHPLVETRRMIGSDNAKKSVLKRVTC